MCTKMYSNMLSRHEVSSGHESYGRDVDFMCPKMHFNMLSRHESLLMRCSFHVP